MLSNERPAKTKRASLKSLESDAAREELSWRSEAILAVLPTLTILLVFALVEFYNGQRLIFTTLGGTAFLIYHDPHHKSTHAVTILIAQLSAAILGMAAGFTLGFGYLAAGGAMLAIIALTLALDRIHSPAVPTALSFAFRSESVMDFPLFVVAVGLLGILVLVQRPLTRWVVAEKIKDDREQMLTPNQETSKTLPPPNK